ncbi:hypothetical protein PTSG_05702 [Salpingoeca rosetta]|uniref:CAP-Gly domain-containing protein n=1 Tax=Salpingoeca rosetta (strain ATCC 50818 / BSB-021) TaxID=946362 RepID=F2UAZ1_SALR5|nr:uncharacterized protein PTSG_05702 [Salpingoeca rosetta]EGD74004.1 hypothetical protein PTSG_05702 [Salpingoeca rosetta]|eukprot:XP_004993567.1 hypothetical protein PTSG_05702 [Salpingoeca rosetta]
MMLAVVAVSGLSLLVSCLFVAGCLFRIRDARRRKREQDLVARVIARTQSDAADRKRARDADARLQLQTITTTSPSPSSVLSSSSSSSSSHPTVNMSPGPQTAPQRHPTLRRPNDTQHRTPTVISTEHHNHQHDEPSIVFTTQALSSDGSDMSALPFPGAHTLHQESVADGDNISWGDGDDGEDDELATHGNGKAPNYQDGEYLRLLGASPTSDVIVAFEQQQRQQQQQQQAQTQKNATEVTSSGRGAFHRVAGRSRTPSPLTAAANQHNQFVQSTHQRHSPVPLGANGKKSSSLLAVPTTFAPTPALARRPRSRQNSSTDTTPRATPTPVVKVEGDDDDDDDYTGFAGMVSDDEADDDGDTRNGHANGQRSKQEGGRSGRGSDVVDEELIAIAEAMVVSRKQQGSTTATNDTPTRQGQAKAPTRLRRHGTGITVTATDSDDCGDNNAQRKASLEQEEEEAENMNALVGGQDVFKNLRITTATPPAQHQESGRQSYVDESSEDELSTPASPGGSQTHLSLRRRESELLEETSEGVRSLVRRGSTIRFQKKVDSMSSDTSRPPSAKQFTKWMDWVNAVEGNAAPDDDSSQPVFLVTVDGQQRKLKSILKRGTRLRRRDSVSRIRQFRREVAREAAEGRTTIAGGDSTGMMTITEEEDVETEEGIVGQESTTGDDGGDGSGGDDGPVRRATRRRRRSTRRKRRLSFRDQAGTRHVRTETYEQTASKQVVMNTLERKLAQRASVSELIERRILLKFNTTPQVTVVDGISSHDRQADPTWTRLTREEKAAIRKELNMYKCREMEVHEDSRHMLRLHEDGPSYPQFIGREGSRVTVTGYGEGTLRFYGPHAIKPGPRCGVELDRPIGLNNGTVADFQYFSCRPKHGVLVSPTKVTLLNQPAASSSSTNST